MSSIDMSLLFEGVARGVPADAPLRIVLLPGEALRIPRARPTIRVLSGTAWLTSEGKDIILCRGQCLAVATTNEAPVISGIGSEAVLFEVCRPLLENHCLPTFSVLYNMHRSIFEGGETMRRDSRKTAGRVLAVAIALAIVLLVAGCSSMGSAITSAFTKQAEPAPQPAPQEPAAQAPAPAAAQPAAGPAIAYQYQFNAFYSGMWNMGWFGYGDANYKEGQGTVWTFTQAGGGNSDPVTFERALLKINVDKSQWWRFKLDSGKHTILYEFIVGSDNVVQKVRYQDPDSGTIGEFVPSQGQQQPSQTADMPKSRADMAKYLVDKQKVTVKGGTFNTDHYLYSDEKGRGSAESWVSERVPGYMVKSIYTAKKDNRTSKGELIQIESGVTTTLSSF